MFAKGKLRGAAAIGPRRDSAGVLESVKGNPTAEIEPAKEPARVLTNRSAVETAREARSIVEGTTRKLNDR